MNKIIETSDTKASNSATVEDESMKREVIKKKCKIWARSFRRKDPRFRILEYFSRLNDERNAGKGEHTTGTFSVWRPTSQEAIVKMMRGEAVGKGLDIKGKSAKRGTLSSFVPFVQIHEEDHKAQIKVPSNAKIRIFFQSKKARDIAVAKFEVVREGMIQALKEGKPESTNWEMDDSRILLLEEYAPTRYGVETAQRLFWEASVIKQDISRKKGSDYDTGRVSCTLFQEMNLQAFAKPTQEGMPRPAVYQYSHTAPLCPLNMLMAYEEGGRVMPVVSDFDCFLVGTRNVPFSETMPDEQVKLMNWCLDKIENILSTPDTDSWTVKWCEVLRIEADRGFHPEIPQYGFGDNKSYIMMETAVGCLAQDGSVRHGAECFNYYFPQELDEEFLIISNDLDGDKYWKYVSEDELKDFLSREIDKGYTFPLNPKWVVCDKGWRALYNKLLASDAPHVQESTDVWLPQQVRDKIEMIQAKYPDGFRAREGGVKAFTSAYCNNIPPGEVLNSQETIDLALLDLFHHQRSNHSS